MHDDKISDETRELPEVQLPVIVFFHCDLEETGAVRKRMEWIRNAIEKALADEDNHLGSFTYPEVRLGRPTTSGPGGFPGRTLDV